MRSCEAEPYVFEEDGPILERGTIGLDNYYADRPTESSNYAEYNRNEKRSKDNFES
jgi:hypothetical protein